MTTGGYIFIAIPSGLVLAAVAGLAAYFGQRRRRGRFDAAQRKRKNQRRL